MVGWDGIEPPTPGDFQTRCHLPARTDELLVSVVIRGLRDVDVAGAPWIRTDRVAPIGHRHSNGVLAVPWKQLIYLAERKALDFGAADR